MDALSALASIATSNAIAGIGAPASTSGNQGPDPSLPVSPPPSASVFLSEFARGLLAQQASDPTLDINTAFAQSLLGLTAGSTNNGQLYTSTGLLQPFASALLDSSTAMQTPADRVGVVEQAALTSEQFLVNTPNDTNATTTATSPPVTAPAVTTPATVDTQPPVVSADPSQLVAASDTTAVADNQPAASTPVTNTDNAAATPAATSTVSADEQVPAENLDPYQQAALISGLTSLGREQNSFIPAASDSAQSVVQGIAAIMPVAAIGSRSNESTSFWLDARR